MNKKAIIIGARGSLLSVAQTEGVIRYFKNKFPEYSFIFKKITTLGDRTKKWTRLDKGIFVKEIEDQLLNGGIDLAVHSMKDLPTEIPAGLRLAAITKRIDPRDVLISRDATELLDLKPGSFIGTSSLRRKAILLLARPDLRIMELRGNLDTRLRKLQEGRYDAIIVAAAGLKRLGVNGYSGVKIPVSLMLPPCGQGALGIEVRSNDRKMTSLAESINHPYAYICVSCEREFLRQVAGGCRLPIAVFAKVLKKRIYLSVMIASLDGKKVVSLKKSGLVKEHLVLARVLAQEALDKGAKQILAEIDNED